MAVSPEYLEMLDHERLKRWMQDHDWSVSLCDDPLDILCVVESAAASGVLDDDTDD